MTDGSDGGMHLEAGDSTFIRARRADIHPVIAAVAEWGRWWPGVTTAARADGSASVVLRAPRAPRRLPPHARRIEVRVLKDRRDLGVDLAYGGDLRGTAEWYYLDERDGTVVHYLLHAQAGHRGWRAALRDHRASVRAALTDLKDRFEAQRYPGDEPDPRLLADQRDAVAAFQAGVEAYARKVAAQRATAGSEVL